MKIRVAMYMSVVLVNFAAALASLSRPVAGVWQTFTPTPHPRVPLDSPNATALDQYVWKPDLSFGYEVSGGMQTAPGCTGGRPHPPPPHPRHPRFYPTTRQQMHLPLPPAPPTLADNTRAAFATERNQH